MRTVQQQGTFGQRRRAYAKAPIGMRVNEIFSMRQNALNRFHTALYEPGTPVGCVGHWGDRSLKWDTGIQRPSQGLSAHSYREKGRVPSGGCDFLIDTQKIYHGATPTSVEHSHYAPKTDNSVRNSGRPNQNTLRPAAEISQRPQKNIFSRARNNCRWSGLQATCFQQRRAS